MRNRLLRIGPVLGLVLLLVSLLGLVGCPNPNPTPAPLSITTTSPLPGGSMGSGYNTQLQAKGGKQPYSWSIVSGSLPNGLTLNPNNGVISGSPQQNGNFNFTAQVQDSKGRTAQKLFSLNVGEQMWRVTARITEVRSPWPAVGQEYDIILKMNGMTDSSHQFVDDVWIPINLVVQVELPESQLAKIEAVVDPAAAVNGGIPQTRTLFNDTPDNLEGPFSGETTIDVWPGHPTGQYLTYFKWQVSAVRI